MRIGIDARVTQGAFTGDSTYWRGLIGGLSDLQAGDEFILYLDARMPHPNMELSDAFRFRELRTPSGRIWSTWAFPRALRQDAVDVAHLQYTIPPNMPCPAITTIHDVSFKRHPEFFTLKDRLILDLGTKQATKRAAMMLTPSEHARREIIELYRAPEDRVRAIHPGVDAQYKPMDEGTAKSLLSAKYGIDFPFVLTLGVIQPRKNLQRLLEGFAQCKQPEHKLVIVGKYGWMEAGLRRKIADLGLANDVVLAGYVPYEDLPSFYNAASVFVYPSVYEGFGLPPLEAMACGTPIITGNRSSLPEVVGDAGLMVDPYDPSAFSEAIGRILSDESLRAEMSRKGLEQAKKFSWTEMARKVLEIYREVTR